MEKKIFKIPPECKSLVSFFHRLKQDACEELRQHGIEETPAQTEAEVLQSICDQNPNGALVMYVRELQKGFQMSESEILAYDQELQQQIEVGAWEESEDMDLNEEDLWGDNEDFDDFNSPDFDTGPL